MRSISGRYVLDLSTLQFRDALKFTRCVSLTNNNICESFYYPFVLMLPESSLTSKCSFSDG